MLQQTILQLFAAEVAEKLGRPEDEIRGRGLSAFDFHPQESVELRLPDGSSATFHHAFFVASREEKGIAVFTEHCGYHVFPYLETEVIALRREVFAGEYGRLGPPFSTRPQLLPILELPPQPLSLRQDGGASQRWDSRIAWQRCIRKACQSARLPTKFVSLRAIIA